MTARLTVYDSPSHRLHAVAERMLASGRYGNLSEVFRAALCLLDGRERSFQRRCDTLGSTQSLRQTVTT